MAGRTTDEKLRSEYDDYGHLHSTAPVGVFVIIALLVVVAAAYYGFTGPGLFGLEASILALGAGLVILTLAVLYLLFSLRGMLRVARNQAAQVAILRAQTYTQGLEMRHHDDPPVIQTFVKVEEEEKPVAATATTPTYTQPTAAPIPTSVDGAMPVETLEGIGEVFGSRLASQNIRTVNDLRSTPVSRVATVARVNEFQAAHWKAMAELVMIPGIGPQEAEVLARTGIHNARALAHHEPRTLFAAVRYVVGSRENNIYPDGEIDQTLVRRWINAARIHVRNTARATRSTTTATSARSPTTSA